MSRDATARDRRRARARAKKEWQVRRTVTLPRASFEELEIRTADGAALRAVVDDPREGVEVRATLVLAHAMFAGKASFGGRDAHGISTALGARGFRTVAFDFRGHGDSAAPGGSWTYDDLVRHDLPAVVEYARAYAEDRPVVVVGHALGGHVALAAQGTDRIAADGIVALATNVWIRDRPRLEWHARVALARAARSLGHRLPALERHAEALPGRLLERAVSLVAPDRGLGLLTDGRWVSADGAEDYLAALARVRVPVAAVVARRDRLKCPPVAAEAFVRRAAGPVRVWRAPVRHDELLSLRTEPALIDALEWTLGQARP